MAYDVDLAERIRGCLSGRAVTEKAMFGGLAFLVHGNMGVAASGQGGLLVRVDPTTTDALLREPGAALFEMRGRSMQGWLHVDAGVLDDDSALQAWVDRGLTYAGGLPPK